MWSHKKIQLDEIGIEGVYTIPEIPGIEVSVLPLFDLNQSAVVTKKGQKRVSVTLESKLDHGSYGNITLAHRNDQQILLKQPRMSEMNLLQEAVLQHLAHKTMIHAGVGWAVPKVYDVFQYKGQVWFSMERISGSLVADWFERTSTPDQDTFHLLAQISLILGTLEQYLNLDHRDLKVSNCILKPQPCKIQLSLFDTVWTLESPFTVVVLDFGFACLGSEPLRGKPWVNLGDGVLPPMDPCPKEGRDLFHLLVSLLGVPCFRDRISKRLQDKIDGWLSVGTKSYGTMARRWSTQNWSYLVSSQPTFAIPSCCPKKILRDLLPELSGFLSSTH
jgi:serine/threonine protein kinase